MIDWVNAILPFPHERFICGGYRDERDADDNWLSTKIKKAITRHSYDNTIAVQTSTAPDHPPMSHIWVSGSPKPLQGHNLFGTDDPLLLAAALAKQALKTFDVEIDDFTYRRWLTGKDVKFTRIDITQMLDVGNEVNAAQWMKAASDQAYVKFRGRGEQSYGTIYFGKRSKKWALKLYRKFVEISSKSDMHALPEGIANYQELMNYAEGTVRSELVLLSQELKRRGLQDGESWRKREAVDVWSSYMEKLELHGNIQLQQDVVEKIPPHLRLTYLEWRRGSDLRSLHSRPTLYRHRAALKEFGIDIFTKVNVDNTVVPLVRVIEARPKSVPNWAIGTPLLLAA